MNIISRLRLLFIVLALLLVGSTTIYAQCPGPLGGWLYRVPVNINNGGAALTDYFVLITMNTQTPISQGKMKADGGDIRVASSTCVLMNFWVESGLNTTTTRIWAKVPSLPSGATTIYVYYGMPSATRTNQASDVFGTGIMSLFTFTEGSGSLLHDWVGGHDLTVSCTWASGFRSGVSSLTGFSTGRAYRTTTGPNVTTGSFTVIDYLNPSSSTSSTRGIIGNYYGDGTSGWVHKLQGGANNFMLLTNQSGGWCQGTSTSGVPANQWSMAGARRETGVNHTGFLNGSSVGTWCSGDNRNVNLNNSGPFEMGRSYNGSYAFGGNISMTLIYNTALTNTQISNLHNSIKASPEPTQTVGAEEILCTQNLLYLGTVTVGDPTQTNRLFRDAIPGVCGTPKSCGSPISGTYEYDAYTITNTGTGTCVHVKTTYTGGSGNIFTAAYNGSFNPVSICTNLISDAGSSTLSGYPPSEFEFYAAQGQTFVIVVSHVTAGATTNYTLEVNFNCNNCTISCNDVTVSNTPNQCGAIVNYPVPSTTGLCGTITCTPPAGSFFPVGATTVNCQTQSGPTCAFIVRVNDTQPPTITCPPTQNGVAANCISATMNYPTPTVTDNCPNPGVVCSPPSGFSFPVGNNTVTCTATDGSLNTATCSFTVAVVSEVKIQPSQDPLVVAVGCKGTGIFTKYVTINNGGGNPSGGTLNWTASTSAVGVTLSPSSGVAGQTLGIGVNTGILAPGNYTRTITITGWNSATNAPACNSTFTYNVLIKIEPGLNVTQTKAVNNASMTAFTNSVGQSVAEIQSLGANISAFTVMMYPCQYPYGLGRLKYVKRYYKFVSNGGTNVRMKLFWTDSEGAAIPDYSQIKIWQQPSFGGAWSDRGGTVDLATYSVTTDVTSLTGVFAEAAPWTPKVLALKNLSGQYDRTTKQSILQWSSNVVPDDNGYYIERISASDIENKPWDVVGNVPFMTNGDYGFIDPMVEPGVYYYRIIVLDRDGGSYESEPVMVNAIDMPASYTLEQNYPNPFNPSTSIVYHLAENARTVLKVYDVHMREVMTLVDREQQAGRYEVKFNASDLPSGVYFYQLRAGSFVDMKKMNLMK